MKNMKYVLFLVGLVILNYFILQFLEIYEMQYFVVMHGSLWFVGGILLSGLYFFQHKKDLLGLIITTGLMMKMIIMFGIFVIMHNKLALSQGQTLNFLFVYCAYTVVYILFFVKKLLAK